MSARRLQVLIADDYPPMVAALRGLLSAECDVVGTVADGTELLESVARLQPDVVVADLNLPGVSGLEACREIAACDRRWRTRVHRESRGGGPA
jgi:CheY-like chemotaxis protein